MNKDKISWEEFTSKEIFEAYPQEILMECQSGIVCSYGICDECPNNN